MVWRDDRALLVASRQGAPARTIVFIEPLDSDGDGFTNIDEIKAGTFPGDPTDNATTTTTTKPKPTTTTTKPFPFSLLPNLPPPLGK